MACGGLRVYSPGLAEIVGLAVHEPGRRIEETLADQPEIVGYASFIGTGAPRFQSWPSSPSVSR